MILTHSAAAGTVIVVGTSVAAVDEGSAMVTVVVVAAAIVVVVGAIVVVVGAGVAVLVSAIAVVWFATTVYVGPGGTNDAVHSATAVSVTVYWQGMEPVLSVDTNN